MKKILGLDLGTNSIGWALVNEAETPEEKSSIIKLGVRVNPLTVDEKSNFEKGKSITTNADRTLKRSMRRNLQRYKLRRENLIEILKSNGFITNDTILSEDGNKTTFETYRLRAKAATDEISLEQFARVLLMINKKRGYKSSRKAKSQEEGQLIDGMEVAKKLYEDNLTPGQFVWHLIKEGKKYIPDFYRSDLQMEFDKIFDKQLTFYPDYLSSELKEELRDKKRDDVWAICAKAFKEKGFELVGTKRQGNATEQKAENYSWRTKGLFEKLDLEQLVVVLQQINIQLNKSSGYLGAISDRSKELYFEKLTVGQYLMRQLEENPNTSLRNQVFYRQDYLDEFNTTWETQAKYHKELTPELKHEIRDVIIFYQRRLKSQKGLINFCEFESREIEVEIEGKKKKKMVGSKVCPKSSPLFQEFKIWQILNNIQVSDKKGNRKEFLSQEAKEILFTELSIREEISKEEALKLLFQNPKELDLNYKTIEGNRTQAQLFKAYQKIIELSGHGEYDFAKLPAEKTYQIITEVFNGLGYNTDILYFDCSLPEKALERQPLYRLWHLLYSFEGDDSVTGNEKLITMISEYYGFEKEYATILAGVSFQDDYGNLSTKAMRKILPHMKEGNEYALACEYAGYRHSKNSLTKEEIENKILKDKLEILPKNSLRNPVVEKILNQMTNVVNTLIDQYGKPDEIRIELARELKKSTKEREKLTQAINKATAQHEEIRKILQSEQFGLKHISRNDIIRYKLYAELKDNGYHTLYSNTYISPNKLFSKEFDIEHIIPQTRLFDDSFSNKTLELKSINIEKGKATAYDFIESKYGQEALEEYLIRIEKLFKDGNISGIKLNKLKMKGTDIPDGFIERDIRDTQYIARKAKTLLEELVKTVVPTTGSITDRLREDWQLVDVMKELNWDKYDKLGLTETIEGRDGQKIRRIKDWTKRNDHRHHAMDALTVAFTKHNYIQYLNHLNARSVESKLTPGIRNIEQTELYRDKNGCLKFKPPIPLDEFRAEAKINLENILVSIKAKNKVSTTNINITKKKNGTNKRKQQTPRGQLHLETIYGSCKQYITKFEKIGSSFNEEQIRKVCKKDYRNALLKRLQEFGNDPKKAFTGKNSLEKNPVWLDDQHSGKVPEKVKTVKQETVYTIRKEISPNLKIDKVVDVKIRNILENRLNEYNGNAKKAFSNLEENPIWQNKEKNIPIKRVTITGISNGEPLHFKKDKNGNLIPDQNERQQPVDFMNTGNNHHVAVYRDEKGELQEKVVSLFDAVKYVQSGFPIVIKDPKSVWDKIISQGMDDQEFLKKLPEENWKFLFSMKQNEYFVFPNEKTGFNPKEVDLLNPENYHLISPNLYRVQKISTKNYLFNHHLETNAVTGDTLKNRKQLSKITYHLIQSLPPIENVVKVRINHIGEIVSVGEY